MAKRATKIADPKGLMLYSAEYCFTPDEALALEGDNQFNTVLLTEQLAAIKLHKITPQELKPKWGQLEYMQAEFAGRMVYSATARFVGMLLHESCEC